MLLIQCNHVHNSRVFITLVVQRQHIATNLEDTAHVIAFSPDHLIKLFTVQTNAVGRELNFQT
jgi:hypothetical protein